MMSNLARALVAFAVGVALAVPASAQVGTQKSVERGVTIAVTPGELGAEAKIWSFKVALDTHSQDLADDLAKSALLIDDKGNEFKPLGWDGAAPGGHHRSGVLKFEAVAPRPQAIELRIQRTGELRPRVFRWDLK